MGGWIQVLKQLDYRPDFFAMYYHKCGQYQAKIDAYEATEDEYSKQYKIEIARGIMKPRRFADYESFKVQLSKFLKDPKNRHRL